MDRTKCKVMIFRGRKLMRYKSFDRLSFELGFEETVWVHEQLKRSLGPDYSLTRVGKTYDFVDKVHSDEFVAANIAGKSLTIKVVYNEITEFD